MSGSTDLRYSERSFSQQEIAILRDSISQSPEGSRHRLALEFCRRLDWRLPDGRLKYLMAKVTMLKMPRDGLITLPPAQHRQLPRNQPVAIIRAADPPAEPVPTDLAQVRPWRLIRVTGAGASISRLGNE